MRCLLLFLWAFVTVAADELQQMDVTENLVNKTNFDTQLNQKSAFQTERCGSDTTNCKLENYDVNNNEVCQAKYQFFEGRCTECDCGDAGCKLDASGAKIDCVCNKTQKSYDGKCINCDCGDADCGIDEHGVKRECVCAHLQSEFEGKCVDCDCGEAPCQLDDKGKKKCVCHKNQTLSKGKCVECDCGEHSRLCYFDGKGGKQCVCLSGTAPLFGVCTACSCGENARSCLYDNQKGGVLVCYCKKGFSQRNDTCHVSCGGAGDCLNDGTCRREGGEGGPSFCECPAGFSGGRCEVDAACERMGCGDAGAECRRNGSARWCECRPGQESDPVSGHCEDICDDEKCDNGWCKVTGRDFECICKQGYTGFRCDEEILKVSSDVSSSIVVLSILSVAILAFFMGTLGIIRRNRNLMKMYLRQTNASALNDRQI